MKRFLLLFLSLLAVSLGAAPGFEPYYPWNWSSTNTYFQNGNVGIGTASPSYPLHVSGSALIRPSATNATYFGASGLTVSNAFDVMTFGGGTMTGLGQLHVGGDSLPGDNNLTVDGNIRSDSASGTNYFLSRLGIGLTNPKLPLHIYGVRSAPATSGTSPNGFFCFDSSGGNNLYVGAYGSSPYSLWWQAQDAGALGTTYPMSFNPLGGNIGIRTSVANSALHVAGPIAASVQMFGPMTFGETNMTILAMTNGLYTLPSVVGIDGRFAILSTVAPCTAAVLTNSTGDQLIGGALSQTTTKTNETIVVMAVYKPSQTFSNWIIVSHYIAP